jgi:hypothetical protein
VDWLWQAVQDFANEWQPRHLGLVAGIVGMAIVLPFLMLVHELRP